MLAPATSSKMAVAFEAFEHSKRSRHCSAARGASRARMHILGALLLVFIVYTLTPYDSPIRAFFRFQGNIVDDYFQHKYPSDTWLFKHQRYPIDPVEDVGVIIKTGYGTRQRVPDIVAALGNETLTSDMLVVQDYPLTRRQAYALPNGKNVPVVDIIGWALNEKKLAGMEHLERVTKYYHLADAIEAEEWFVSDGLSKEVGWELDALKFIPALHYAWLHMPKKKWYVMADDDTYVIKESLSMFLGHLDPRTPRYLGNPVGEYKGRFAHGGSSSIISGAALSKLFDGHPSVVAEAYAESPIEIFGDKIISEAFMKVGIYLDESYSRLFNGEPPHMTRLWKDRFCLPLVSFHGLGDGRMHDVGNVFKGIREPVFWRQLPKIYDASDISSFIAEPIRVNMNFVGRLDEHSTTVDGIPTVEECFEICARQHSTECLAWAYDPGPQVCHWSPWTIIGDYNEGFLSGINAPLAQSLSDSCHSPPAPVSGQTPVSG